MTKLYRIITNRRYYGGGEYVLVQARSLEEAIKKVKNHDWSDTCEPRGQVTGSEMEFDENGMSGLFKS